MDRKLIDKLVGYWNGLQSLLRFIQTLWDKNFTKKPFTVAK